MDYEAWRCKHDTNLFCPDEGCPVTYGCSREKGWRPGMESPRECRGLPSLENMVSHKNYSPEQVALARLAALVHGTLIMSEGQLANVLEMDRIAVRALVDNGRDILARRPLEGLNGAALMKQMGL